MYKHTIEELEKISTQRLIRMLRKARYDQSVVECTNDWDGWYNENDPEVIEARGVVDRIKGVLAKREHIEKK